MIAKTPIDLQELALERPQKAAPTRTRKKPVFTRYVLPGAILLGFVTLLLFGVADSLWPRQWVTVIPVIVSRAEIQQEGTSLFQAAGWIEPRPSLVNVAAMTEGVVEQLMVVEGQEVNSGEPIAKLIDVDAKLALRQAEAAHDLRQAELESTDAELKAARLRFANPVHLQASLAEAQSALTKSETDLAKIPFLIQAAEAQLKYADENLIGKEASQQAISGRLLSQARSERESASAVFQELRQRTPRLESEIAALRSRTEALSEQLRLLIDETRQVEDAEARRHAAEAKLRETELAVEQANLRLRRITVRAPVSGKILRVLAHPGTRVMGLESAAGQSSSIVVAMYDPKRLQVRADVRLEDFPMVRPGQPVLIETASMNEPMRGTVLLPTSSANIQKNTLEVKVAIDEPPPSIRPEMLVTATFLAPPHAASERETAVEQQRLLVPRQLVQTVDGVQFVWIVDSANCALLKNVKAGKAGTEELIEIVEGLLPTDKLITSGISDLANRQRVEIRGEDASLGIRLDQSAL